MHKIVWKTDKPVRIYEVAGLLGITSKQALYFFNQWQSVRLLRSPSSSMPLSEAITFLKWMSE